MRKSSTNQVLYFSPRRIKSEKDSPKRENCSSTLYKSYVHTRVEQILARLELGLRNKPSLMNVVSKLCSSSKKLGSSSI